MASYHHLLQHTTQRFESPAKVFAKLKSKVQREEMCAKEPPCNVRAGERRAAEFKSPRKRAESTWMTEEPREGQRFGSYRNEAQALTLSPISSPQKNFGFSYSDISIKPVEDVPPSLTHMGHRQQIHAEAPQIRGPGGFRVTGRTPVKLQPVEDDRARSVFEEECAPLHTLMSPAHMFSPMRLRKRKWEPQELNKVSSSSTKRGTGSGVLHQPQGRKTSRAVSEGDPHTGLEDCSHVRRFSADRPEMNQFTHEPMFPPPRPTAKKREILSQLCSSETVLPASSLRGVRRLIPLCCFEQVAMLLRKTLFRCLLPRCLHT